MGFSTLIKRLSSVAPSPRASPGQAESPSLLALDADRPAKSKSELVAENALLRKPLIILLYWLLGSSVQKMSCETEKDLHSLLANTGRLVYNQTSSPASSCSN